MKNIKRILIALHFTEKTMPKLNFIKHYKQYTTVHDLSLFKLLYLYLASFSMIAILFVIDELILDTYDASLLIAPFGASCVILYTVPHSAFARARALIGGHIISAFVAISLYKIFGTSGIIAALAVSTSLISMLITDTVHPPASATAFSLMFADPIVHELGYAFLLVPCLVGTSIMWLTAYFFRNLYTFLHITKIKKG